MRAGMGAVTATGLLGAGGFAAAVGSPRGWRRLGEELTGRLVLPSDADYDLARQLASAQFDSIRPRAIAYCQTAEDVRTCVRFAQDHDIHATPRSGGHSFTGWSTTEGLVIDVSRLKQVRVEGDRVRLGAGGQADDVATALAPHGVSLPAGLCPTVSAGGFITGGGLGWQTRMFGPASDQVVSAEVVLADGRIVRCSDRENADLYWALRGGGGGNFGIVTEFEMAAGTVTRAATFSLSWPFDAAAEVISSWQRWIGAAPERLASGMGVLLRDAEPAAVPKVLVSGAFFGPRAELEELVGALVSEAGSQPLTRTVAEKTYHEALMALYGCAGKTVDQCDLVGHNPEATLPRENYVRHRSRMFNRPWPRSGVDDALAAFDADRRAGQYRWLGLLSLGGNANKPAENATAYVHRDAEFFSVYSLGLNAGHTGEEDRRAGELWVDGGFAAFDPHSNGRTYSNYPDTELPDWRTAYYGRNHPRLAAIKKKYDPHGFFRFPQAVA
ncbi:FAD-binding oxidoreductase [Saccharopolyspora spinosporotrichia]